MTRIYAPVIADRLTTLQAGQSITVDPWFAAPADLAGDALEEAEYEAMLDAAAVAAGLVGEGNRRVVLAAEVDRVERGTPVAVGTRQVAALYVDETTEHSDEDLLWHDVSEIPAVLDLLA